MIWHLVRRSPQATDFFLMRDELDMWFKKKSIESHLLICFVLILVTFSGCRPEPIDTGSFEMVYTFRRNEAEYDFGLNKTYSLPSEVYSLGLGESLDSSFDQLIIDTVAAEMAGAGYDRVPFNTDMQSDVVIFVSKITESGWMFGGEHLHYFHGLIVDYPETDVNRYVDLSRGSVVLTMLDPFEPTGFAQTIFSPWAAGLRRVLVNGDAEDIADSVERAFFQSEYLQVGPPLPTELDPLNDTDQYQTDGGTYEGGY